nr:hypothetical protein [Tanacetum cinerariifolium]
MATTIEQQVALDEALVPSAQRLRIGRSNFRLPSDIQSKESTLQVEFWATAFVHLHSVRFKMDTRKNIVDLEAFREMLHISPRVPGQSFAELPFEEEILEFLRTMANMIEQQLAFDEALVPNVPEIYMQELWATATVHQHSIRFKMDTRKHIVDLESFREMLHINPRVLGQSFAELPFEEEILEFLRFLGHSTQIKTLTDVNVNKLYQPWRSFAAVINKCLTKKSNGFDSLRLSQVQILWGLYHRRNVDFAFLIWEDLVYQVEHKNQKKSSEMLSAAAKGKQPARARSPIEPLDVERIEAEQLKIVLRRSRHETHISQQGGSSTDEGTEMKVKEDQVLRIGEEERMQEEEEADELYRDVDINQGRGLQVSQDIEDSHMTLTSTHSDGQQENSSTSSFMTNLLNPIIDPGMEVKFLEDNFSNIPGIVNQYMHQQMPEAVREAVQTQTDRLQDSIQRENDEFLSTIDDNMKKIIKEQVKSQVQEQITRILPRIEESVNAQLEEKVLTRLFHSSRTSYAVAAYLSEMELKKILINKMEGNKSIQRSDEQRNLYNALVKAYDADKTILESYGESAILKKRREDDDQEGPSAGSDRRLSASESAFAEEPVQTIGEMEEPSHPVFETGNAQTWISALVKQTAARSSFNEILDTLIDFSNFIMNRLGIDTLTPELLPGPPYELMKGSCNSLTELEYHLEEVYKATMDQLDWVNPKGQQYPHNLLQPLPLIPDNQGRRVIPFKHFINNNLEYL